LLKAKYVLQDLAKLPNAWIFAAPVDAKALNLPDYHVVITEPMDMGTVKQVPFSLSLSLSLLLCVIGFHFVYYVAFE
jgi:hypothetical protein